MDTSSYDPDENDETNHGVGNGMPRWNQRAKNVSCHVGPIKSDRDQRDASEAAEQLIDDDAVGLDPGRECENTETLPDESARTLVGISINVQRSAYPGNQYQQNEPANTYPKYLYLEIDQPFVLAGSGGVWSCSE